MNENILTITIPSSSPPMLCSPCDDGSDWELTSLFSGCMTSIQQLCSATGLFCLPAGVMYLHRQQCPSSLEEEPEDGAVTTRIRT